MKKRTPAQQQYHELKQQNTDCVLFFRMGDFYEMFHEDAHIAHKVLGITLTARDKTSAHPIPMAWFPHHAVDRYLPKLIDAWYKVAFAEQVWEVIQWTVVHREVTQIITPWTYIWSDDPVREIVALWSDGAKYWVASGDSSLWEYMTWSSPDLESLFQWLMTVAPREIVLDVMLPNKHEIERRANQVHGLVVSTCDVPLDPAQYVTSLAKKATLEWYGEALVWWGLQVMSLLVYYLQTIQWSCLIQSIWSRIQDTAVRLDPLTIRNLELFKSQYEWTAQHSLVAVIDHCKTVMWTRLLHRSILTPTRDLKKLELSHHRIADRSGSLERDIVRSLFSKLNDLTKLPAKLQRGHNARGLLLSLQIITQDVLLHDLIVSIIKPSSELVVWLNVLLVAIHEEEWFFVKWYDMELDRLRDESASVDDILLAYHQQVVVHTWISWVRIKYTWTQWYCLETSKKDAQSFLATADDSDRYAFHRRQSLKSAERFSSPYLAQLEEQITHAQQSRQDRFDVLLVQLIQSFELHHDDWYQMCGIIAKTDMAIAASVLIDQYNRTLPQVNQWVELTITWWRHPVVEKFLSYTDQFIPNDLTMSCDDSFHLITWPNMWGKSTYLRQNALIVLLAHAWLPVPASRALVPLVDGIYARVGSGDALAKNQSTFMTEMIEMANIINNATKDSFIVLDELGRGTSTFDGMSLAYALTINLCQLWVKTLFATHYHELIQLQKKQKRFSNWQVSVIETDRDVVFMKKIIRWGANKSYGLHVARRAWIPDRIVDVAQDHLNKMLQDRDAKPQQTELFTWDDFSTVSSWFSKYDLLIEQINALEITTMTPVDALVHLHQLKIQILQMTSTDSQLL